MKRKIKQLLRSAYYFVANKNYRKIKYSGLFDSEYYRDRVPGLQNTRKNPLIHYIDFGNKEGKSPSPFFDPFFYGKKYGISAVEDSFVHYLTTGIFSNNHPCTWFDPEFYQQHYSLPEGNKVSPLKHYLTEGLRRKFYPNSDVYELAEKLLEISPNLPVIIISGALFAEIWFQYILMPFSPAA